MSDRIEKAAMASDETIEKAVEVVWECGPWTDQESLRIARALAEAGLLAPAPLTEEWTVWGDLPEQWGTDETFDSKQSAEQWIRDNEWAGRGSGRAVHRHISDWEAADGGLSLLARSGQVLP